MLMITETLRGGLQTYIYVYKKCRLLFVWSNLKSKTLGKVGAVSEKSGTTQSHLAFFPVLPMFCSGGSHALLGSCQLPFFFLECPLE